LKDLKEKPIYAIAGPTASGKTELGIKLAEHVGGEVINFDSVQIYKMLQVATAKPTLEERRGIPHHLIDYVDPFLSYTAADWAVDAAKAISDIESRNNIPIFVGGTGFYLRTLLQPLFEGPKPNEAFRERLIAINHKKGAEHLHKLLTKLDPELAAKLFPKDYVRTMRGIEYFFQTGEKLSEAQPNRAEVPEFAARVLLFVLNPPRDRLYEKINARTEMHFANGLVEEVKWLLDAGISESTSAMGSHGYRRVCEYLRGERSLDDALKQSQQDVRNYAKRQVSWFKREKGAIWLDGFGGDDSIFSKLTRHIPRKT